MSPGGKIFSEILGELREINRINRELVLKNEENRIAIKQMAEYLRDFQKIIDFVVEDSKKENQKLMHDLRAEFVKLNILLTPDFAGEYRQNYKIVSSESEPIVALAKPFTTKMAENAVAWSKTDRAFYRIGYIADLSTIDYETIDERFPQEPSGAENLSIVSTSANDTAGGTGATAVMVSGLDSNLLRFSRLFR